MDSRPSISCVLRIVFTVLTASCASELVEDATQDIESSLEALLAGEHRESDGAAATCTLTTWNDPAPAQTAQLDCDITDTEQDGSAVYVEWSQDGYGSIELTNPNGAGSTLRVSDARWNPDGGFGEARWRVCRALDFGFDNCSDWQRYHLN